MTDMLIAMLQLEIGLDVPIALKKERPWASITFSGTRYRFAIGLPKGRSQEKFEQRISELADHEFDLPGHFVADFLVHEKHVGDANITIEILTIADPVSEED